MNYSPLHLCPYCRSQVLYGARYCPICGEVVDPRFADELRRIYATLVRLEPRIDAGKQDQTLMDLRTELFTFYSTHAPWAWRDPVQAGELQWIVGIMLPDLDARIARGGGQDTVLKLRDELRTRYNTTRRGPARLSRPEKPSGSPGAPSPAASTTAPGYCVDAAQEARGPGTSGVIDVQARLKSTGRCYVTPGDEMVGAVVTERSRSDPRYRDPSWGNMRASSLLVSTENPTLGPERTMLEQDGRRLWVSTNGLILFQWNGDSEYRSDGREKLDHSLARKLGEPDRQLEWRDNYWYTLERVAWLVTVDGVKSGEWARLSGSLPGH